MTEAKRIIKRKMLDVGFDYLYQLGEAVGLDQRLLHKRLTYPSTFRAYEIQALREVLGLTDEEVLVLVLGEEKGRNRLAG